MNISEKAKKYREKLFPHSRSVFAETDPEFAERFENFAFDETINHDDLDDKTRLIAILAALIGCRGTDAYSMMLPAALNCEVTPAEIKEVVYQAVDYCGFAAVLPILKATNEIFADKGIALPLENRAKTTMDTRLEAGVQAQVDIFGAGMKEFYKSGPQESRHINLWLAENCFGDYYTRSGLDLKQREMITFCFISAQGGCEPQLIAHASANIRMGNDKAFLIKIISQCLPYIGYPRSLNALRCVNEAAGKSEEK